MQGRRRWSDWPGRLAEELNGTSGVAGLGGLVFSLASWSLFPGAVATVFAVLGAIVTLAAIALAVKKSIPPLLRRPEEFVGHSVPLATLAAISPSILTIALVGPTQVGKTTLRQRLSFDGTLPARTQHLSAYITSLQTTPMVYLAILDGGGERLPQQLKLAELCDCLCIMLDHNASGSDVSIDPARLAAHSDFLRQLRHQLDEANAPRKKWIHFLLNKQDLWGASDLSSRSRLEQFGRAEMELWRQGRWTIGLDIRAHSNSNPIDVASFVQLLKKSSES